MSNKQIDEFYSQLNKESNNDDELKMPNESNYLPDIHELLDNADPKHIYLSGDWHFFKHHYKKEHNYVNTQEIVTWCRQNIKPDDVFIYLGDISFRYANKEDQTESQKIMASIPGIKILILGNHDIMLGQDYFVDCGFSYVFERIEHGNIIYTHKPINIDLMPEEYINIHAHIHKWSEYNTTDGKRNINVYPSYYNNKPVTLDYCLNHINKLTKDNKRSNWTLMGESNINLETSRANLKDNEFGIPEDRKFPLDSEKHIKSAIKLFGHAEEAKKKALAKRIKTAAKKYNIKIPETTQVHKYLSESSEIKIREYSMAAMNPVIGITKPYIVKMCNDCGGILNAKRYALATDLISDKYLVINENANLEIVDRDSISDMLIEEYEFVGDIRLIKKIEEAYYNKKTVDNTFFYTALTGKPMLSEDQIDFDPNFKKVNFEAMQEKFITQIATLNESFMEAVNEPIIRVNVIPNNHIKNLLKDKTHITIMEDLDGYYVLNTEKNIRSVSIEEQDFITEQMIYSVL